MATVGVTAVQVALDLDDPLATRRGLDSAVRSAAQGGAELVVFPELASAGTCFRDAAEAYAAAQSRDGEFVSWLSQVSDELGVVVVSGFAERAGSQVFNSAVVVDGGTVEAVYRKVHLWGEEPRFFAAGDNAPPVVATRVGRIAPMVCYDAEFPEWVRMVADAGAEIVAVPANWPLLPRPPGERPLEVIKAQAAAGAYRVFVVVADRCGRERGQDWIGGSVVVGPAGYLLAGPATALSGPARPALLRADIEPAQAHDKSLGSANDARADRRSRLYRDDKTVGAS